MMNAVGHGLVQVSENKDGRVVAYPVNQQEVKSMHMGVAQSHPGLQIPQIQLSSGAFGLSNDAMDMQLETLDNDPLFNLNFNMNLDVGDGQIESQLLDLLGMVLTMQTTLVQYYAVLTLSSNLNPRVQEAAMRKAAFFRKQLNAGNRKLFRISNLLAEDRKNRGIPSVARPPTLTIAARAPNKRGRGRLLKCEKHRRWKKRCPMDCPDKPLNTGDHDEEGDEDEDDDGDDGPNDEDDMKDLGMGGPPGQLLGSLGVGGAGRGISVPSNSMQTMLPPQLMLQHLPNMQMRPMHPVANSALLP